MRNYLNLKKQYIFYNKYHKNTINKIIHIGCIPMLVWSTTVMLSYIDLNKLILLYKPYELFESYTIYLCFGIVNFNGASILATFYTSYYLILHLKLGIRMYFILYFMQITSYYFHLYVEDAWKIAILLHIFSWMLQISGHIVFEKNMPAFNEGLIQSFLTAPIFVLIEITNYRI